MPIVASCAPACDPSYIFANQAPDDIHFWVIAALCCGVLLLIEAAVIALWTRSRGMLNWHSTGALLPGIASGIVLVLVLRGWSTFMGVTANPTTPNDYDSWFQHLQSTWQSAVSLGIASLVGTIVVLLIGLIFLYVEYVERG